MAALTADTRRKVRNAQAKLVREYTVGTSSTVYVGSLCALSLTTGRVVAASAATNRRFAGVAEETATGDTNGTVKIKVSYNHEIQVDANTALTVGHLGANVAIKSDNEVTTHSDAGTSAVRVTVGELVEFDETNDLAWVRLRGYAPSEA